MGTFAWQRGTLSAAPRSSWTLVWEPYSGHFRLAAGDSSLSTFAWQRGTRSAALRSSWTLVWELEFGHFRLAAGDSLRCAALVLKLVCELEFGHFRLAAGDSLRCAALVLKLVCELEFGQGTRSAALRSSWTLVWALSLGSGGLARLRCARLGL